MVNGARVPVADAAYRPGHALRQPLLTGTVAVIFGDRSADMLSGYRVLSRRFVKSFPGARDAASRSRPSSRCTRSSCACRSPRSQTPYRDRPAGSHSKLRTFRDGWRILRTIFSW